MLNKVNGRLLDYLASVASGNVRNVYPTVILLVDELVEGKPERLYELEEAPVFLGGTCDDVCGLPAEVLRIARTADFVVEAAAAEARRDEYWAPESLAQGVEHIVDEGVQGGDYGVGGDVYDAEAARRRRVGKFGDCEIFHSDQGFGVWFLSFCDAWGPDMRFRHPWRRHASAAYRRERRRRRAVNSAMRLSWSRHCPESHSIRALSAWNSSACDFTAAEWRLGRRYAMNFTSPRPPSAVISDVMIVNALSISIKI